MEVMVPATLVQVRKDLYQGALPGDHMATGEPQPLKPMTLK